MTNVLITQETQSNTIEYRNIAVGDYFMVPGIKNTIYLRTNVGAFIASSVYGNQGVQSFPLSETEVIRILSMNIGYTV